jgi:hypothetical protein
MYFLRIPPLILILFFLDVQASNAILLNPISSLKTPTLYQKTMDNIDKNWRFIWGDDLSNIYLKENSKKINKNIINLEALTNYNENSAQWSSFSKKENGLSEVEQVSFDCMHIKYKSLGGSWFEGHQAKGKIKSIYNEKENWSDIPTYYQKLYEIACVLP